MEHPFFSDEPLVRPETEAGNEVKLNKYFEREYMNSFDEDVIKDIFRTLLRKSGKEEAMNRFIALKDIQLVRAKPKSDMEVNHEALTQKYEEERQEGSYDLITKKLFLDTVLVKRESIASTRSNVLAVVFHEELHALTHQEIDGKDHMQVGLETVSVVDGVAYKLWTDFNEGMTELIMDDLFDEYIRRTGDRKDFATGDYRDNEGVSSHQAYFPERIFVNSIIMSVSKELGLPLDTVREAFVQAYISGMLQDEIRTQFKNLPSLVVSEKIDSGAYKSNESLRHGVASISTLSSEELKKKEEEVRRTMQTMFSKYVRRSLV